MMRRGRGAAEGAAEGVSSCAGRRRGVAIVASLVSCAALVVGLLVTFVGAASGSGSCAPSTPYGKAVAGTSGAVSFWRMGDASGSSVCDSVGTNTGTYQGGFTLGKPGAIVGDSGTAVALNGSTGSVSVPSASTLNTGDVFSVEAWVKRGSTGTTQTIASKQTGSWVLQLTSANKLSLGQATSSGVTAIASSTSTLTDTSGWHYVVATKSGSAVHLYLDGTDVTGTVSNKTLTNNSSPLQLGENGTGSFLNGTLDDVALYSGALTATQVADHYRLGLAACYANTSPYPSTVLATNGLLGYWRLGEPSGTTACDSTGQDPGVYASGVTLGKAGALASDSGTAALFNGSSGNVSVPSTSTLNVGDAFSIEGWVKRGSTGTLQTVASKQSGAWALAFNAANQLELLSGTSTVIATSTSTITDTSAWHYVVATKSGSSVHLFIDGRDVTGTVTNTTLANNSSPLQIGENGTGAFLNGTLEEVALYNAALSAGQVHAHYANGVIPDLTAPSISGTATDGQPLTAGNGTWGGSPTGYTYQWQACDSSGANCTAISGATATTLTLGSDTVGSTIRVVVTATNAQSTNTATSAQTATIQAAAPVNTTAPAISGTPTNGQTLTADHGAWSGTAPLSYAYQWQRCTASGTGCTGISGATSASYTAISADVGSTLRVQVTASNAAGSPTANSPVTATVLAAAPVNITAPAVTGTAQAGQTVTTDNGAWTGDAPISYTDQWQRCDTTGANCADIAGATGSTYQASADDVGATLRVRVTATNAAGSATAPSAPTPTVAAIAPANTTAPAISGTAQDGQTLTASSGSWSGTAPLAYSYQWQRCDAGGANCTSIQGATAATYQLTSADVGSTLLAQVTATNASGSATATTSATGVVAAAAPVNGGAPAISGSLVDGQTLSASPGTWSGTTPIAYAYQWRRCDRTGAGCADIDGAISAAYQLTPADVGATLQVVVTASNSAGSATATSSVTPVTNALPPANTTQPTISGNTEVGQTLTATTGDWSGDMPITYAYQWLRCDAAGANCVEIPGATIQSYEPTDADAGNTLSVILTASNSGGSATASAVPTAVITVSPPANTTAPMVTRTAVDGQTLTSNLGNWTGDNLVYSYQWQRCDATGSNCSVIFGATASSYQAGPSDVNATLEVAVTATNPGGTAVATSAPSDVIAAAPAPTIASVVHSNLPIAPVASGDDGVTITAASSGPGIQQLRITDQQGTLIASYNENCSGTFADPCPATDAQTLTVPVSALPLGQDTLQVTAVDAAGLSSASQGWSETVVAPSTCSDTWSGPAAGDWSTASNWSLGTVPGDHDYACLPGGTTVDISGSARAGRIQDAGSLEVSNATFSVDDPSAASEISEMTLGNGGTLTGAGEVDIAGALEWTSTEGGDPTMSGPGSTVIEPGATATLAFNSSQWFSYGQLTDGRSLVNEGTMTLADGVLFAYGTGESIDNRTGGVINLDADGTTPALSYGATVPDGIEMGPCYYACTESASMTNEGQIIKPSGTGTTDISFPMDNSGTVGAASGTIDAAGGSASTGRPDGSWGSTGSGSVQLGGGTWSLGSMTVTGELDVKGSDVTATDVQASQGSVVIGGPGSSGSLTTTSTSTASHIRDLTLATSSTLSGAAEVDVAGSLDWSDQGGYESTMSGSGSTVIEPGATATLDFDSRYTFSYGQLTDGRSLVNEGTLALTDGVVFAYGSGESIDNRASGTIYLLADGTTPALPYGATVPDGFELGPCYYACTESASMTNEGQIIKPSGTGTTEISFPMDNSGGVSSASGTIDAVGGSASSAQPAGSWGSTDSGVTELGGGTWSFGSTAVSGNLAINGGEVTASDLQAPEGNVTVGGTAMYSSGSLTTTSTSSASHIANLTLTNGGTLAGSGEVDVTGALDWTSTVEGGDPSMSGGGSTVIEPGATATLDFTSGSWFSYGQLTNGRSLINEGTMTLADGVLFAYGTGNAIDNRAGGVINLVADGTTPALPYGATVQDGIQLGVCYVQCTESASLTNEGQITKQGGSGATDINFAMDNSGTVESTGGTLDLNGGSATNAAPDGSWESTGSGITQLGSGTWSLGTMRVSGDVRIDGGQATASDVRAPQGSLTLGGAAMYSSGGLALTSTSTPSHIDDLILANGANLSGSAEVDVATSLQWKSIEGGYPTMSGSGSTVIEPGATATLDFDSSQWFSYGQITDGRTLVNEGTMNLADGVLFAYGSGESIDNRATGTINLEADGRTPALPYGATVQDGIELGPCYTACTESASLTNEGQIVKPSGTGTTQIDWPVNNTGSVTSSSGTLSVTRGTSGCADGSWVGAPGSPVEFLSGSTCLGPNATVKGPAVVDGGTVTTPGGNWPDADLTMTAGSLTFTGSTARSVVGQLDESGGTLSSEAELDITSPVDWTNGTISGSGTAVLEQGGTIHPAGQGSVTIDTATVENDATLTMPSGTLDGVNGATLRNDGTFSTTSEATPYCYSYCPNATFYTPYWGAPAKLIIGPGAVFDKAGGTGVTTIGWQVDNEGATEADSGQLNLAGGGVPSTTGDLLDDPLLCPTDPNPQTGTWNGPGGQINFSSGCWSMNAQSTLTGDLYVGGATIQAGAVNGLAATITDGSGELAFEDQTAPAQLNDLAVTGGLVAGPGEADISDGFNWQTGILADTGALTIGQGAHGLIDPPAGQTVTLDNRSLINNGDLAWTGGSFRMGNNAVLVNHGTFEASGTSPLSVSSGQAAIYSDGTVTGPLGISTMDIGPIFVNKGGTIITQPGGGQIHFDGNRGADGHDDNDDTDAQHTTEEITKQSPCYLGPQIAEGFEIYTVPDPTILVAGSQEAYCGEGSEASGNGWLTANGIPIPGTNSHCITGPDCVVPLGGLLVPGTPGYVNTAQPGNSAIYQGITQFSFDASNDPPPSASTNPVWVPATQVKIPDFGNDVWSQYQSALAQLGIRHLRHVVLSETDADTSKPANAVISVSPSVGTLIDPNATPVAVTTNPSSMRVPDLAKTLRDNNDGLDVSTSLTIAAQCLTREDTANPTNTADTSGDGNDTSYRRCGSLPIFISGLNNQTGLPSEATESDIASINRNPSWVELNYEKGNVKIGPRDWYNDVEPNPCPNTGGTSGKACHEFPFFATQQGGPKAYIRTDEPDLNPISAPDNSAQGRSYGGFISKCAMSSGVPQADGGNALGGDAFLYIPIAQNVPSMGLCNGKTLAGDPYQQPWGAAPQP